VICIVTAMGTSALACNPPVPVKSIVMRFPLPRVRLPSRFRLKFVNHFICLSYTCYMNRPAHTPRLDHTHSLMKLSPSSEAANCAATQELPSILWNLKVHFRFTRALHWSLSRARSIQSLPTRSYLSKIHHNIVHPHTSWSS
jgi:hypothetical protein